MQNFFHIGDGALGLVAVIDQRQLELAAMHPALGIDLGKGGASALLNGLAKACQGAGQGQRAGNRQALIGHARGRLLGMAGHGPSGHRHAHRRLGQAGNKSTTQHGVGPSGKCL